MKRKGAKLTVCILLAILLLWGVCFLTDYLRCSSLKAPVFVVAGQTADDGGSGTYYGLGYTVQIQKQVSAQYGLTIESVQMQVFGKVVSASVQ